MCLDNSSISIFDIFNRIPSVPSARYPISLCSFNPASAAPSLPGPYISEGCRRGGGKTGINHGIFNTSMKWLSVVACFFVMLYVSIIQELGFDTFEDGVNVYVFEELIVCVCECMFRVMDGFFPKLWADLRVSS